MEVTVSDVDKLCEFDQTVDLSEYRSVNCQMFLFLTINF